MKKIFLFFALFFLFGEIAYADTSPLDLNSNGILDKDEAEVVLSSNVALPAGEYFFNNLIITNNAVLTLVGNSTSTSSFKGVKISVNNLIIMAGSSISADKNGYYPCSGPGQSCVSGDARGGGSYGGVGGMNGLPTYGSAIKPTDLGSGSPYVGNGGGAIWLVVGGDLINNGTISADGAASSSGGSIYVTSGSLTGTGTFHANGGGYSSSAVYLGQGGGGRIAIYYKTSSFTGQAIASGGCGSLGMGYPYSCAGNGTVGFFDTTNNDFYSGPTWRFQKSDSPFIFNQLNLRNGADVTTENGINITADNLLIDGGTSLTMTGNSVLTIPTITIDGASTMTLSGEEVLTTNTLTVTGNSRVTVVPEKILTITIPNLTITSGSSISADEKGYWYNAGPGAPAIYWAGASYGGVGVGNVATSTYGSAQQPTNFGSGGNGRGGGAIRLIVSDVFINDGTVSVNGGSTSSGGSIYVTANKLAGAGIFNAEGGQNYCPGNCFGSGGGGRVAIHFNSSTFTGKATALAGMSCYYGCARAGGNGTVGLFDETDKNLLVDSSWRFQKNDSPVNFHHITLTNNANVETEEGAEIKSDELLINKGSSLTLLKGVALIIPRITLDEKSFLNLSGGEIINAKNLFINGSSTITIIPEKILAIAIPNVTISTGSSISADARGYGYGAGPGASATYWAGASYGGVGQGNTAISTYGSEREPVDFGSGGNGYNPHGGGAIRLITDTLTNDGKILANGDNTSSGGSIYVTTKNLTGTGLFSADGGDNYCPNGCIGAGGGGRIAIYYGVSTFTGDVTALGGNYCFYGCQRLGGNGTVVMEQFEPAPTCTVDCFSNVLFLPGIEASRLYLNENGSENQLWEPNRPLDVEKLYLNEDGTSKNTGVYTTDIVKETNTPISMGALGQNIYKSFSNMMDGLVADGKITEWKAFPYDWRMSVDDVVDKPVDLGNGQTIDLIAELKVLIKSSKSGRVTIIAHSNGGLVAKVLLAKLQEMKNADAEDDMIDHVDLLILVAVPQIGTAMAVPSILHGYDQSILGGWIMDMTHARELGRNMPSGYGLLPSMAYINHVDASPIAFIDNSTPSGVTTNFVNSYGNVIDSYSEYKDFLFGTVDSRAQPAVDENLLPIKLSPQLFDQAENLHNKIDTWTPPSSLRVIEVAGWGLDTVASFQYYPKWSGCKSSFPYVGCTDTYTIDERPIFTKDGDGTVVEPSALYGSGEKVWVNLPEHNRQLFLGTRRNREHKDILEVNELNDYIVSLVEKKDTAYNLVLTDTKPIDTSNRLRISIHSPVTLGAYDLSGNFTGKICPPDSDFCYKQEDIPNSSYLEFGEGKYLNIPENNIQKFVLQGTDTGTFTYESTQILLDGQSKTTTFTDIPVTTQTKAEITLNKTTHIPELALDITGDGKVDFTISPQTEFNPILFLQIMRKTVELFDITKQQKNTLLNRIDDTIKAIQKGKINKAKLKIEQFKKVLTTHPKESERDRLERERKNEREHEKEHREKQKPKQIAPADVQILLTMLNQLLDNLNK